MQAHLYSARLAPKKANIVAKMIRGMSVPVAMNLLQHTTKKSARMFETVLRSAVANAEHNFKQDAQTLILKTVIVNQGTAYRRGIPMARGRVRPIRKFLSHITIELGVSTPQGGQITSKKKEATQAMAANAKARKAAPKTTKPTTATSKKSSSPAS